MSVKLVFESIVARRDSIESKYPGGWNEWKKNHDFFYDDHLYRVEDMDDVGHIREELASYGMVGIYEDEHGTLLWKDYCIIAAGPGPEIGLLYGKCDWIDIDADNWTAKMTGVPDSQERHNSAPERK